MITEKEIEKLQQQLNKAKEKLSKDKEKRKKLPPPPKYEVVDKEKGEIIKKDKRFLVVLTKFFSYLFITVIFWIFTGFVFSQKLVLSNLLLGIFSGLTAFILTILLAVEGFKFIPYLLFKLNEQSLKSLLKITMFTLTGKIKHFYVKPSVDADFSYNKGLYIVDDGAKYWDGNYYNSYYVEGLPPPLKLKRTSNVQAYYKSVEKIKTALLNGDGWEEIQESDIDNLICFSHSAKQLGEYKKDKIFTDLHKSKEGDKILMAVIGMAIVGFICMVVVVVLILVMGN